MCFVVTGCTLGVIKVESLRVAGYPCRGQLLSSGVPGHGCAELTLYH